MSLPSLANWDATRDALHEIALVIGAIRVACTDPLSNDLHFSLDVTADGISTTRMRCGGELHFDFKLLQLKFVRGDCVVFRLDVARNLADYAFASIAGLLWGVWLWNPAVHETC